MIKNDFLYFCPVIFFTSNAPRRTKRMPTRYIVAETGEKLGIQLPEEFSDMFYQLLQQNGFTYGDDMKIIRLVNGFMTYHNLATKETAIFYQPTPYSGNYFEGIIQKADHSVLVCKAYADRESNTLHIIPAYGEEKNEEQIDFFHALDKLTLPHKNNYFTSGFLTLGLTLRDSKIICYGINKVNDTAQATPYEYDCNKDAYVLNENLTFTANDKFLRESTKEALFLQYEKSQA